MNLLLLCTIATLINAGPAEIVSHDFQVTVDVPHHRITVRDELTFEAHGAGTLLGWLNRGFVIEEVSLAGTSLIWNKLAGEEATAALAAAGFAKTGGPSTADLVVIDLPTAANGKLTLRYHGEIFDQPKASEFNRQAVADQTTGLISDAGAYIAPSSAWYLSQPMRLDVYRLRVDTPKGFEVMSEGDILSRTEKGDRLITEFGSPYPFDGLHIIAGPYIVTTEKEGNVDVMTYFFPGSEDLTATYLRMSRHYVKMYGEMLGEYPFGKFAVVENFFPTGYGMPSYTLLGSQVIRLPFIPFTSLGHEVLHNWWGNSVYVDYASGNWCEGLTSYGADYLYLEQKSAEEAAEYRRNTNRDYTNYVNDGNDFPLTEFLSRHDASTRAVGYGKTMMVYHTIRRAIGEEAWAQSLKTIYSRLQWKLATWDDLLAVFAEVGGKPMGWVRDEYLVRPGAPFISLASAEVIDGSGAWVVNFTLEQAAPLFTLDVPVVVRFDDGEERVNVSLAQARQSYSLRFARQPRLITVDPDSDLFRRMHRDEMPAVLSQIFGGEKQLIVLPDGGSEEMKAAYAGAAAALNRTKEASVKNAAEITDADLKDATVMVLGDPANNSLAARWQGSLPQGTKLTADGFTLMGSDYAGAGKGLAACFRNPLNGDRGAVLIMATDAASLAAMGRLLPHYGKYGYLAFDGGKNVAKGIWPVTESPLIKKLGAE